MWHTTVARSTAASGTVTGRTSARWTDSLWDHLADFVRFHARNALGHHASALDLLFTWDAARNSLGHGEGLLTTDLIRNAAGLRFGDGTAGLDWNSSRALFRNQLADLVRDSLRDLFTDHFAGANRNLVDDLFGHHTADLNRNLGDDRLGNLAADRHRDDLLADHGLIRRARNLLADDVRTPDGLAGVESSWDHRHASVTAFIADAGWEAEAVVPDFLRCPATTIAAHRFVGGDRLHGRVATFLIDRFADVADHRTTAFLLDRLGDRSLHATANFASAFFPHGFLDRVVAFAIHRFGDRTHHGVGLFAFGRFDDLASDLVLLFAVCRFHDIAIAGLLHVFIGRVVHGAADRVRLRFLDVVIDCPLTLLTFHAACRVTCCGLAGRCRTTAITSGAAIAPSRCRLWR